MPILVCLIRATVGQTDLVDAQFLLHQLVGFLSSLHLNSGILIARRAGLPAEVADRTTRDGM